MLDAIAPQHYIQLPKPCSLESFYSANQWEKNLLNYNKALHENEA